MNDKSINIEALKNASLVLGLLLFFGGGAWFLLDKQTEDLYNYYFFGLLAITIGFKMGNSEPYTPAGTPPSSREMVISRQIRDRTCLFLIIVFIVIIIIKNT